MCSWRRRGALKTSNRAVGLNDLLSTTTALAILGVGLVACGGSASSQSGTQGPSAAGVPASHGSAPTIDAAGGSACSLVSNDDVAAAAGYSITKSFEVDSSGTNRCTFQGTEAGKTFYLSVFTTADAQKLPLELEATAEPVAGLGDSAFWTPMAGLFVHKGGRILGLQDAALGAGRDAIAALATKAMAKF
jgi:hypothetical protein